MGFAVTTGFQRLFSITAAVVALGAFSSTAYSADSHDHHHHEAPHGGTLITLGDHAAHLEVVLTPQDGRLTAYVLDGEAANAIRVKQPTLDVELAGGDLKTTVGLSLKGVSNPLTGEASGDTSQFEATSPALKSAKKFQMRIKTLTIKGVPFENVTSPFPEGNH